MHLLKKTMLASLIAALLPVASFAQTEDVSPADDAAVDIQSYWAGNNEEALEEAFEDYSLSWGSYILSLGHESKESTRFSDLFHAFTADFTQKYGVPPQQATLTQLQNYYKLRKDNFGGELLLPTMAVWNNRPMLSIVPLPDQLDAYWNNPDQAADTYDYMAAIDRDDTLYYMGSHMGAFFGHPTKRKTLENFWKKWLKRDDSSAAKQDVNSLKRIMLAEMLSHDPEYAVQELASKKTDLWPAVYTQPVTEEESARVREIITDYCLKDQDQGQTTVTDSCMNFAKYADHFEYTNDIVQAIREQLSKNKAQGAANYDEIYNNSTTYVITDPELVWPYDPWYGWYYRSGVYIYIYTPRVFISPWYWRYWNWYWHRPVIIGRPGHHRPPVIHHGHRPPVVHPGHGGHHPGRPGTHRPPNGRPGHGGGHHPGSNGRRPGDNHGNQGHHGGNGDNPGHNGHNGNGHNPGGNGHNPGGNGHNPGGNGHNPGGNGHNPGGNGHNPGGNGGSHGNGDNPGGNPPTTHGGNTHPGTITNGRTRPSVTREDPKPATRSEATREIGPVRRNTGNIGRASTYPSSGYNGSNSRPSTTTPSRSSGSSFGGSSRPSGSSFGGSNRSSGSSFGGSNRSSSSGRSVTPSRSSGSSFGGSSRSSGSSFGGSSRSSGGFSGGSHGGSSSGSRGSGQGDGRRR